MIQSAFQVSLNGLSRCFCRLSLSLTVSVVVVVYEEPLQMIEGFEVGLPEGILSHGREGVEVQARVNSRGVRSRQRNHLVLHQRTLEGETG